MSVFVDTSGLLAVMDAGEDAHERAARVWRELLGSDQELVTSNYVVVEASALVQHRLGTAALRVFQEDVVPAMLVVWVGEELHQAAVETLLAAGRKRLSLVDCVSFAVMRREGVGVAFTLDRHFKEQGFRCLPA